jgi:NADPH-dependent ferric siderophore reductase
MPALVDRLASAATKPLTRTLVVTAAADVADGFRRIDLRTSGELRWEPGQKVQIHVKGFEFRTYTPFAWDGDRVSLLAALDASGPGTDLVARLAAGDEIAVFGPRRAMDLSKVASAPIVIGDETSFALGAAWEQHGSVPAAAHLYEVSHPDPSAAACEAIGLPGATLVERTADDGHLDRLCELAVDLVRATPDAPLVLTGKAQTVRAVRGALKAVGLSPATRVKAHWDPNRSGLD